MMQTELTLLNKGKQPWAGAGAGAGAVKLNEWQGEEKDEPDNKQIKMDTEIIFDSEWDYEVLGVAEGVHTLMSRPQELMTCGIIVCDWPSWAGLTKALELNLKWISCSTVAFHSLLVAYYPMVDCHVHSFPSQVHVLLMSGLPTSWGCYWQWPNLKYVFMEKHMNNPSACHVAGSTT